MTVFDTCAAGALRNLACSAAGRDKIAEHSGVEKLVVMLAASRAVLVQVREGQT
jgi:hypothetical protein